MGPHFALALVTGPQGEPITLGEAKAFCRVDYTNDDELFQLWIEDVRRRCERVTGRQMMTATWRLTLDGWPPYRYPANWGWGDALWGTWTGGEVWLPKPPLQSVTSVQYLDTNGTLQTLATTVYSSDIASEPGRIYLNDGEVWPSLQPVPACVRITYVAGFGVDPRSVPSDLRGRMLTGISYLNEKRAEADEQFLDSLFARYWDGRYGSSS